MVDGAAIEELEGRTVPCLTVQPPESRTRVGRGPRSGTCTADDDVPAAAADEDTAAAGTAFDVDTATVFFFRGRLTVVVFLAAGAFCCCFFEPPAVAMVDLIFCADLAPRAKKRRRAKQKPNPEEKHDFEARACLVQTHPGGVAPRGAAW